MCIDIVSRPVLVGSRIVLRAPLPEDRQDRLAAGRDPVFRKMVGGDTRTCPPLTATDVDTWYRDICGDNLAWVIALDNRCIGTARLHSLDEINRRARYAIGLFSLHNRGLGIGTESTRLVLKHAFLTLHLHRVDLRVLTFNNHAIACYKRCGFIAEGIEREGSLIAGEWQSDLIMSILESEYSVNHRYPT